ncbi:hypothetical protein [Methylobacterium longum]|uniref:Uncharacterized protein n=1 Tax=Methylobacterium longum TaxID=767694 RepID=A0ABT8AZU2_9HYPH|nr:hypothetical protein [Methylobacterium longum]MDN3575080.1 hypothetical protein [Methylobacterium longum]GJE14775.1 hypothetical protein FOHLNKBM_5850 [Methylobacterium longum]
MAEIHILPARHPDADQITRLSADLAAAQEQGVDLGSRVSHIHANGETLLSMSHGLEGALDRLRQSLHQLGMQDQLEVAALQQLLEKVQDLADRAQRFSSGS